MGLCPFHDDHDPSFGVTPSKNLWNCLAGCGGVASTPRRVKLFKIGYANRTLGYRVPTTTAAAGKKLKEQLQRLGVIRQSGQRRVG
jgi:hypothetical protein